MNAGGLLKIPTSRSEKQRAGSGKFLISARGEQVRGLAAANGV